MEKIRESLKKYPELVSLFLFIAVGAVVVWTTNNLFSMLAPFIIAYVVTRLLHPMMVKIKEKTHMPNALNTAICMLTFVVVVGAIIWLAGHYVVSGIEHIIKILSSGTTIESLVSSLESLWFKVDEILVFLSIEIEMSDIMTFVSDFIKNAVTFLSNFSLNLVMGIPNFLMAFIIGCVAACYMLFDYDRIAHFVLRQCGENTKKFINVFNHQVLTSLIKMILSYALISIVCFSEMLIGFAILGIENGSFLALLIAIFDVLPVVGSGAILVPWGIIALIMGDPKVGIGLIILWGVIVVVRQIIEPKIVGDQVGLYPLITVVALYLGLKLMGGLGLIMGPLYIIICKKMNEEGIIKLYSWDESEFLAKFKPKKKEKKNNKK